MSGSRVAIVDYGLGNLFNIARAITHLEGVPEISSQPEEILSAERIVLPGVGAFRVGMENLTDNGSAEAIREARHRGTPILGICLGMQLLMTSSEEDGHHQGLNLIPGRVERLDVQQDRARTKVPQIGWNTLAPRTGTDRKVWDGTILEGLGEETFMYFVHSYCVRSEREEDTIAETEYGGDKFASVVRRENISGCQFHPERSAHDGIRLLRNFLNS